MSEPEKEIVAAPDVEEVEPIKDVKSSVHIGDEDFSTEVIGSATWGEVFQTCCVHSGTEWLHIAVGLTGVCFFLYFFLFSLELLGTSAKIVGGCSAGEVLGDDTNPIGALMIGVLGTVLLQSSSTTTSIIVGLAGSGLSVKTGIYMVFGANIGTTVTNTIVAMGQMGDADQLERAFAGATVHDVFNYMSVIIILPLEIVTHYLYYLTKAMVSGVTTEKDDKWEGPIKKIVSPLAAKIIKANKDIIKGIANYELDPTAKGAIPNCDAQYNDPDGHCQGLEVNYSNCRSGAGLITCDKNTGDCPLFFNEFSTQKEDETSGGVCLFISLVMLVICLIGMVTLLQRMLMGMSTRIIYKATNLHPILSIIVGCGVTMIVQSSSITTSVLTPLCGLGVVRLEVMLPLTLGANIGTTITGILASLVTDGTDSLQVALAHLFFNLSGILLFYPLPVTRNFILDTARKLGKICKIYRFFPVLYILFFFFMLPAIFIGISFLFEEGTAGYEALGTLIVIFMVLAITYSIYWYNKKDGKAKAIAFMENRQLRNDTTKNLPQDMELLKSEIARLKAHTGLVEEGPASEED